MKLIYTRLALIDSRFSFYKIELCFQIAAQAALFRCVLSFSAYESLPKIQFWPVLGLVELLLTYKSLDFLFYRDSGENDQD